MRETNLDLHILYDLSDGDATYICDVLNIYMESMDNGLDKLMRATYHVDYETIEKQAHALKSSAGIVKVGTMYEDLQKVEDIGRTKDDTVALYKTIIRLQEQYSEAIPLIEEEIEKQKCKPS